MNSKVQEFTCNLCKETFEAIDMLDAEKEYDEVYRKNTPQHIRGLKGFNIEKRGSLCEDCFKLFCAWAAKNPQDFSPEQLSYFKEYIK